MIFGILTKIQANLTTIEKSQTVMDKQWTEKSNSIKQYLEDEATHHQVLIKYRDTKNLRREMDFIAASVRSAPIISQQLLEAVMSTYRHEAIYVNTDVL